MAKQGEHGISWTEETWNPIRGCSMEPMSACGGCLNCYAAAVACRFNGPGQPYEGLARQTNSGPRWTGEVRLIEEHLNDPLRWRKPRRVFVNSMSDLFHEALPVADLERIFRVMLSAPQHTFQVLTKRAARMREWVRPLMNRIFGPHWQMPPHIWLGVSVEDEATARARVPELLQTPAAVRWISYEPALGPVDFSGWLVQLPPHREHWPEEPRLNWIVAGGESGAGARPAHPDWFRRVRDDCQRHGVPFHFKQVGAWAPDTPDLEARYPNADNTLVPLDPALYQRRPRSYTDAELKTACPVRCVGKSAAGRLLDGVLWDQFPEHA